MAVGFGQECAGHAVDRRVHAHDADEHDSDRRHDRGAVDDDHGEACAVDDDCGAGDDDHGEAGAVDDDCGAGDDDHGEAGAVDDDYECTSNAWFDRCRERQFSRTLAEGWGAAEVGGEWTVSPRSSLSVDGVSGRIVSLARSGRSAFLKSVSTVDSDLLVRLSSDKIPGGSGLYVYAFPRQVAIGSDYRGVLRFRADGQVGLRIDRSSSVIAPEMVVPDLRYTPNMKLNLRVQAVGSSPTTVRARVWPADAIEPTTWMVSTTDSTAGVQSAGRVGLGTWLSGSAKNAPVTLSIRRVHAHDAIDS